MPKPPQRSTSTTSPSTRGRNRKEHGGKGIAIQFGDLTVGGAARSGDRAAAEFEVTAALGKNANATYDLTVTLPEEEPKRFEGLPQNGDGIKRLDWFGFVSNADAATTFYIDDIAIHARKE